MMTLEEAIEKIARQAIGGFDKVIPASELKFINLDTLLVRGAAYRMLPSAKQHIAKRFRIPLRYIQRCPGDLQAWNLNNWLEYLGDTPIFCRFRDEKIRAFFSTMYRPINNGDIVRHVMAAYPPDTRVELRLSNEMMLLDIPDYEQTFNIKGDDIAPGLNFSNSEVGLAAYTCGISYQRLAPSTRFIAAAVVSIRHATNNWLDNFMATLKNARGLPLHKHYEKIYSSQEREVKNPKSSIAYFGKQFGLHNLDIASVQHSWELEPGHTLWHIVLAFAREARGEYLSLEKAYRLQRIGGRILSYDI
jgi:hypothetical protein